MGQFLVPFNSLELTDELREKAKIELNEFEETRSQKLQELRNCLIEERDLTYPQDDVFLLQFLRTRKFHVERAFTHCKNYFKSRNGILWRGITYNVIRDMIDARCYGFLPYRDSDGCLLVYSNIGKWDPSKLPPMSFIQTIFIAEMAVQRCEASQVAGYKMIVNCDGFGAEHFLAFSTPITLRFLANIDNVMTSRFKGFHAVHQNRAVTIMWMLVKPVLKKKFRERCHFHGSDMAELHRMVPPSILPLECGGELGNFDNRYFREEMERFENVFHQMMSYGYKTEEHR